MAILMAKHFHLKRLKHFHLQEDYTNIWWSKVESMGLLKVSLASFRSFVSRRPRMQPKVGSVLKRVPKVIKRTSLDRLIYGLQRFVYELSANFARRKALSTGQVSSGLLFLTGIIESFKWFMAIMNHQWFIRQFNGHIGGSNCATVRTTVRTTVRAK